MTCKDPICQADRDTLKAANKALAAEYDHVTKLVQKIGLGQRPLLPDPSLPQDVAFLAHMIDSQELQLQEAQRDLSSLCHKIGEVTQDECSCEGSGPTDPKCCLACRIYHRLNGTVTK